MTALSLIPVFLILARSKNILSPQVNNSGNINCGMLKFVPLNININRKVESCKIKKKVSQQDLTQIGIIL